MADVVKKEVIAKVQEPSIAIPKKFDEKIKKEKVVTLTQVDGEVNDEDGITLDFLVDELENVLSKGHYKEKHIFNRVQALMETFDASHKDIEKYKIKLNEHQYTRNLVKKSDFFTLMILVWPPDIASPIHDHGGSECWLRVIDGNLEELFYDIPEKPTDPLKQRFKKIHGSPGVCFINDNRGLHSIVNPSSEKWAVSLHCYVPGYMSCNAFFDEKCAIKGRKQCKMTFTSIGGKKVVE